MIPPNEFKVYICEECPKAFITYSLEGSHLECSLPDRIFANSKYNDLISSCPQFRDGDQKKLWKEIQEQQIEEFISVEEMEV
jgi:hypothetical protein